MAAPQPPPSREADFLKAALYGDLKLLERLASEVADGRGCEKVMDRKGKNALHFAAAGGKTHVCKFLVEKLKFNVKTKEILGNTPLLVALLCEKYPTAIYLIENGVEAIDCINHLRSYTALHLVAEKGNKEIMSLLLSKGAKVEHDLNITLGTPLELASSHKTKECAKLLLDYGADPNLLLKMPSVPMMASSPLMSSVATNSFECLDLLLKAGADPNMSACGRTPLQNAVIVVGDARVVERLLKAGANANVFDPLWLITPLEIAATRQDVAKVKTLFPFTSRISYIPDWSVDGIIKYWSSEEARTQIRNRLKEAFELSKAKGREAFEKKDYEEALKWYTKASDANSKDATVYSNLSLCWVKLNRPIRALNYSKLCVALKPDWAKGHYRMGAALMLLNDSSVALEAFSRALRLDPNNMDIKKAYREAQDAEFGREALEAGFGMPVP